MTLCCRQQPSSQIHKDLSDLVLPFSLVSLSVIAMPLTQEETLELQRLMAKAKSMPSPPPEVEEEFTVYDPTTGLFMHPETGEVHSVWSEDESSAPGAMTDGSKRREEMIAGQRPPKKSAVPKAKSQAMMPSLMVPMYAAPSTEVAMPFPGASDEAGLIKLCLPPLPDDVPDVPTWGRTVIGFGHYKDLNMSYEELVMSEDSRMASYVKWCRSRTKCAQGQLKDLCNYMQHMFASDEGTGHQIPGTTQPRRLKQ